MSKTCKWKVLASTEQRPTGLSPKGYRALIRSGRGSRHGGKSRHELKQGYDVCSTDNVGCASSNFHKDEILLYA